MTHDVLLLKGLVCALPLTLILDLHFVAKSRNLGVILELGFFPSHSAWLSKSDCPTSRLPLPTFAHVATLFLLKSSFTPSTLHNLTITIPSSMLLL